MRDDLLNAAYNGDLRRLKRLVRVIDDGVGRPRDVVEAATSDAGLGALLVAVRNGHLELCRYLVQGLRVDVDAADNKGRTTLFYAAHSEHAAVVKYLLDHGADPDKADEGGISPLHCAAGTGNCKIIELLLAKGAHVDPIADDIGTPLLLATKLRLVGAMKTLLDHNADPNKPYFLDGYGLYPITPLFQAVNVSVECVKLLVEAGAVITSDCLTAVSLESTMVEGRSTECLNFLLEAFAKCDSSNDDKHDNAWKISQLKSFGSIAVERKNYFSASAFYTKAIDLDPSDATLFSNRSLCLLRQGNGHTALLDAIESRELRPDWPKACYRHGAALMSLEDYGGACEALLDGLKLDPKNAEMERALREAMESLKTAKGTRAR
ncbi:ankyrin repeat and SOCS box protein 13-like [Lolium rigidum]|uniref:ankyrin repeat and SOCS box protein 13-like n=1 Tax=Lolium rigidum TaxID=89674 RepID=UPI001F5D3C4E|nr:ankyrin repeat and SOCS box protein 13-like [Lolium rigidum]